MRSKYINSTPGRKCVTENGLSNIDFLYDVDILDVRRCLLPNYYDLLLRMRSFHHITTSGLTPDVNIWI